MSAHSEGFVGETDQIKSYVCTYPSIYKVAFVKAPQRDMENRAHGAKTAG